MRKDKFFSVILLAGPLIVLWAGPPAMAVEYTGRLFRDPFGENPAGESDQKDKVHATPSLLEGVFWSSGKPLALISGKIVQAGDKMGNAEVLEIRKDGVKMREKDRDYYLRFKRGALHEDR